MAELSSALPKNCVLYQFSFATLGELPAFFAGWTAVLDAVCITTILCRTWSEHVVGDLMSMLRYRLLPTIFVPESSFSSSPASIYVVAVNASGIWDVDRQRRIRPISSPGGDDVCIYFVLQPEGSFSGVLLSLV
ncbi:unnamed protein product [Haemonchus placei]|uniref:AA_permease domain-containing protein n=1 Tax=Haemonchus placei TaxID=6290 RepID=A0A0N4X3N9_HAEPC|nr:unnamed protein product [Haemonchus placei]